MSIPSPLSPSVSPGSNHLALTPADAQPPAISDAVSHLAHQLNSLSVSELPLRPNIDQGLQQFLQYSVTSVNDYIQELLHNLMFVNKSFAKEIRESKHSATVNLNLYPVDPVNPQEHIERFKNDLSKYPNLTKLKLTGPVTDEVLKALQVCTKLEKLDLGDANMTITNEGLKHLSTLNAIQDLDLSSSFLFDHTGFMHLIGLKSLRHLDLSWCMNVDDSCLEHLKNFPKLKTLNLMECTKITGLSLRVIGEHLKQLECLNLWGCEHISNQDLMHLSTLEKLSEFWFGHLSSTTEMQMHVNRVEGRDTSASSNNALNNVGITHLSRCSSLETLYLKNKNEITPQFLETVNNSLSKLKSLALVNCDGLDADGLLVLSNFKQLQDLYIASSNITDEGALFLQNSSSIKTLHFENCPEITQEGMNTLRELMPQARIEVVRW